VKALFIGVTLVGIVAPASSARPAPGTIEGRHDTLRAGLYATVIDSNRPIQVLDRLCPKPGRQQGCEPVLRSLQRAFEEKIVVRWVSREHQHWGTFYELGPIVRNGNRARFDYRWDDPRPYGCNGGGREEFRRIDWTGWRDVGGYGFGSCPGVGVAPGERP
jgi:hypothetical protein